MDVIFISKVVAVAIAVVGVGIYIWRYYND